MMEAEPLRAMWTVRPQTARQFFALATQHMRWQRNDQARRLDMKPLTAALPEAGAAAPPASHRKHGVCHHEAFFVVCRLDSSRSGRGCDHGSRHHRNRLGYELAHRDFLRE